MEYGLILWWPWHLGKTRGVSALLQVPLPHCAHLNEIPESNNTPHPRDQAWCLLMQDSVPFRPLKLLKQTNHMLPQALGVISFACLLKSLPSTAPADAFCLWRQHLCGLAWHGDLQVVNIFFFTVLFFCFFLLFRAAPAVYWGSQARRSNQSYSCQPPPQPQQRQIWALVCHLHHSSRQLQTLNPPSKTRDRTHNLMVPSWIHCCCATRGTTGLWLYMTSKLLSVSSSSACPVAQPPL